MNLMEKNKVVVKGIQTTQMVQGREGGGGGGGKTEGGGAAQS